MSEAFGLRLGEAAQTRRRFFVLCVRHRRVINLNLMIAVRRMLHDVVVAARDDDRVVRWLGRRSWSQRIRESRWASVAVIVAAVAGGALGRGVAEADLAAGDAEPGVIEGGGPVPSDCLLRSGQRDQAGADGTVEVALGRVFGFGILPGSTQRFAGRRVRRRVRG